MLQMSAPASLMVCGEHAVVQGYPAIVAAIDERLLVSLQPRSDQKVLIESALACHETDLSRLAPHPDLRFVLACIAQCKPRTGFVLTIDSQIHAHKGFGSSAAVVVATLAALARYRGEVSALHLPWLHQQALSVILQVQGRGSGADLAAALQGGLLAYYPQQQNRFVPLPMPAVRWSVRYAGYKTKTAIVLAQVAEQAQREPKRFAALYAQMGQVSTQAIMAAEQQAWETFYRALNDYQALMVALGVCDAVQAEHIAAAQAESLAVKISGSGLGDCILACGENLPPQHEEVSLSQEGLKVLC